MLSGMDIKLIFDRAGGAQELARQLGVRHQALYQWDAIPPLRVLDVCRITGLRPFDVRPDLYPSPAWSLDDQAA